MKAAFEKFLVNSLNTNEFIVRVSSPSEIREILDKPGEFEKQNDDSRARIMLERYLFIEEAIKEKLERVERHRV